MSTGTDCDIGRFPHDLAVTPYGWQPRRRDSLAAKLSRFSLWLIDYVLRSKPELKTATAPMGTGSRRTHSMIRTSIIAA
jgi:hypothetical protein